MPDKTITCKDCGATQFTESDQAFFAEKGYTNEPTRCPDCRAARKQARGNESGHGGYQTNNRTEREMFSAVCATCGKTTTVPFKPSTDKPVYCRDCFKPRRR